MAKLNALATKELGDVRVLPGSPVPYKPVSATALSSARLSLSSKKRETNFRQNIISLMNAMHKKYGLLLYAHDETGFHRNFSGQADLRFSETSGGPGESAHQYGHAIDLGFHEFKFYNKTGALTNASFWLTYGPGRISIPHSKIFWDARNVLAKPLNVLTISGSSDIIHLRSATSKGANTLKSLVALLDKQSTWKWQAVHRKKKLSKDQFNDYKCDLGGTTKVEVGNLREVWSGDATVDKAKIEASGWKRPKSLVTVSVKTPASAEWCGLTTDYGCRSRSCESGA